MSSIYSNLLSLFLLVVLFTSCQKTPNESGLAESHQYLYQSWIHSFEEQAQPTDSIRIYRPEGFKEFPPGKFRMKYVFEKDGSCQWLVLYPADAHYLTSGRWETSPDDDQVILLYNQQHELLKSISFKIVDLKEDLLKIKIDQVMEFS